MIITNPRYALVGYSITSYPTRAHGIIVISVYYMALSHNDWELPNSWIWLAETDIDRRLDFPIWTGIQTINVLKWNSCKLKCKISDCFHEMIFISVRAKKLMRKKSKQNKQILEELNSAHSRSQAKCKLVQPGYIKKIKLLLFLPYNKHLINRAKSVCMGESWPRPCVQTSLRSVCTYDLGQDSPIQTLIRDNCYMAR